MWPPQEQPYDWTVLGAVLVGWVYREAVFPSLSVTIPFGRRPACNPSRLATLPC